MLLTLAIWFMARVRVVTFHLSLNSNEAIDSTLENLSMESHRSWCFSISVWILGQSKDSSHSCKNVFLQLLFQEGMFKAKSKNFLSKAALWDCPHHVWHFQNQWTLLHFLKNHLMQLASKLVDEGGWGVSLNSVSFSKQVCHGRCKSDWNQETLWLFKRNVWGGWEEFHYPLI